MIIPRPTYNEIVNTLYNDIVSQTPLNAELESSVLGVIVKTTAAELDRLWGIVEEIGKQTDLTTAYGDGLDRFGAMIGVLRKQAQKASSIGFTKPVRFTNLSGSPITVPSGTRVWGSVDPSLAFFTDEGVTIGGGESQEVHITAAEVGEVYNLPVDSIDSHSYGSGSLTVRNILPIREGSYRESDDAYRSRLINEFRARVTFNKEVCESLLLRVANIKNVVILEHEYGPGTYEAIVVPHNTTTIAETLTLAQQILDEYNPIGVIGYVVPPLFRYLDVDISLTFKASAINKSATREEIKSQIVSLIDNTDIEQGNQESTLFLNQIRGIALNADSEITGATLNIGLDGNPISSVGELTLRKGEKLVLRSINVI